MPHTTHHQPPFRVALVSAWSGHRYYGAFLGVLDYSQHVGNWQIIGDDCSPTFAFADLDYSTLDGVIGSFHEQCWAEMLTDAGIPAVNLSNSLADVPLPRVSHDEKMIGRLAAEHLLACGYPNFAFLGKSPWYSARRLAGFRSVIEEHAGRPCLVLDGQTNEIEQGRDWLSRLPLPVAIMGADDYVGRRLIRVATELGLRVPNDVGVVGVNNDAWLTQLAPLTLSSVEPDWHQLGYRGAQILDELMSGETPPTPIRIPPLRLVKRQSTDAVITEDPLVTEALGLIRNHCGDGLNVEYLTRQLGVSRRTLENRFRGTTGQSPYEAICNARIERAKGELIRSKATLAKIADNCGLGPNRFYVLFKRATGMTPGQYRARFGLRHSI